MDESTKLEGICCSINPNGEFKKHIRYCFVMLTLPDGSCCDALYFSHRICTLDVVANRGELRVPPGVCEKSFPEARQKIAAGNAASTFATVQNFPFDEWLKGSVIPSDLNWRITFFE